MDREPVSVGEIVDAADQGNAARYIARERQKRELRRERDAIVLALAGDLGERGLAERFGVSQPVAGKLVADARERMSSPVVVGQPRPGAGAGADRGRWAEVDAHFAALGRGSQLRVRRRSAES